MTETTDTIYVDPVCGYKLNKLKNLPKIVHNGTTYYFCSKKCSGSFRKKPEKYTSNALFNPLTIRKKVTANLENSELIFKQLVVHLAELDINSLINIQTFICGYDGIIDVNIDSAAKKLMIKYNPDLISEMPIREILTRAGLKIKEEIGETVVFFIADFLFTGSTGFLTERLKKLDGVNEVTANVSSEEIIIRFNPEAVNKIQLKNYLTKLGYQPYSLTETKKLKDLQVKRQTEKKNIKNKIIVSFIISLAILLSGEFQENLNISYLHFFLASLVQFGTGSIFYKNFARSLVRKTADYNSLIITSTTSTWLYSSVGLFTGFFTGNYFYIPSVLTLLFLINYFFVLYAREKFSGTLDRILQIYPEKIKVIRNDEIKDIYIEDVQVEDIIEVDPEQKIPLDGVIINGNTNTADTPDSPLSFKSRGDNLASGSINKGEKIQLQVAKPVHETVYYQKAKAFEVSLASKTALQIQIERFSSFYPLFVLFLSVLTFVLWYIFTNQFHTAFLNATSVLVVGSPLLFNIASGYSYLIGLKKGAENSFLYKDTESINILGRVNTVYLNKSGVLTSSRPVITDIVTYNGHDGNTVLKLAASVENHSESLIGKAIVDEAKGKNFRFWMPKNLNYIMGMGIEANVNGYNVLIGSKQLMRLKNINLDTTLSMAKKMASEGKTLIFISISNEIAGIIAVADLVREGTGKFVDRLKKITGEVYLFSGDTRKAVTYVAEQVGINLKNTLSELTPAEKIKKIENYKKNGKVIALITKKVNYDDPVFKSPDIILNLDSDNDKVAEVNYIKYSRDNPELIITSINLSKKINRTVKQNLLWLLIYLLLAMPVAAGLLYFFSIQFDPVIAALSSTISLVFLFINSLDLNRVKSN